MNRNFQFLGRKEKSGLHDFLQFSNKTVAKRLVSQWPSSSSQLQDRLFQWMQQHLLYGLENAWFQIALLIVIKTENIFYLQFHWTFFSETIRVESVHGGSNICNLVQFSCKWKKDRVNFPLFAGHVLDIRDPNSKWLGNQHILFDQCHHRIWYRKFLPQEKHGSRST